MSTDSKPQADVPVVVVTGGTQGLGLALTQALFDHGFALAICARTRPDVDEVRALLDGGPGRGTAPGAPKRLVALTGDVGDRVFRRAFIEETVATLGRIDGLVNNASTLGAVPLPHVLDGSSENEARVFDINVFAPLDLIRLAYPHIARQPRALVLGVSSDAAIGGYPGWSVYGASKAALDLVHKTLASELADAGTGVQVHSVDPGDMDTAMHHAADPEAHDLLAPDAAARALLPLFLPLLDGSEFPFASGLRLRVTANGLEVAER